MTDSVRKENADLVTVSVLVDGKPASEKFLISKIDVEHRINHIPAARVAIEDGSVAEGTFDASESSIFVPGAEIEVKLGYHAKNKSVFKGLILRQNIRMNSDGNSGLVLVCNDEAIKAAVSRSSAQFHDLSDSDIVSKLLADSGLPASVEATEPKRAYQAKNNTSDWDFIVSRAEANGQVVIVENGKVTVAAPKFSDAKLKAELGAAIIELDIELDATDQVCDVKSRAWDPKSQTVVEAASSEPSVNEQGNISGKKLADVLSLPPHVQQSQEPLGASELEKWSNAKLLKNRLSRFRGRVRFVGNPDVKTGDLLDLAGLGARFNGSAYVSAVRHSVSEGAWWTEIELGLPSDPERETAVPATTGLQIAKVVSSATDPEGEGRIQVMLPLQKGDQNEVWIRVAAPYATENAGLEFLPEVGDEIVVGFLGGDPDAPIMLGALHSSARPPPLERDEQNSTKAIVTNSKMKIGFDDAKKILTVQTPGGHQIAMNDEAKSVIVADGNGNELEMTESGISLNSPKNITITASGSVSIDGSTGVNVKSSADVGLKGANASVEGQMAASVKGGASAELSAGGTTTVKGSMVTIN